MRSPPKGFAGENSDGFVKSQVAPFRLNPALSAKDPLLWASGNPFEFLGEKETV
jgi:hypothetical protein